MALTDKEKYRVLYYLGWPGLTLIPTSTMYNKVVNDRLVDLVPDIEKLVKELLEKLQKLDDKLEKAQCRLSAKSVDNIEMNPDEIPMLKKERKRLIKELSDWLEIPIDKQGNLIGVVC